MEFKELTMEDMEGIEIKGKNRFDVLVATTERAKQILEKHDAKQGRETDMRRKRERSVRVANAEGEGSLATDSVVTKRRKCNARNNRKNIKGFGPQPPPPLPVQFKNVIQAMAQGKNISEETLVIQKGLFDTDLSKNHNRLSIPISQISHNNFLTEEEKEYLGSQDKNNKKNYLEVKIIEPSLERGIVKFSRWDMPKNNGKTSYNYVINGTWNNIVDRNKLKYEMVVQLWSFRIEEELCLALVRLPKNPTSKQTA